MFCIIGDHATNYFMDPLAHSSTVLEQALLDFFEGRKVKPLLIHNTFGEPDEMSPDVYFRVFEEMPDLEEFALEMCEGKILDVGAGVGAHATYLQDMEKEVDALDISDVNCQIMEKRGVKSIINADYFQFKPEKKYDTLLLMMNGLGFAGDLANLHHLLDHARTLLHPDGAIVFDSSDVSYLWDEKRLLEDPYFGEIDYQYQYGDDWGPWFKWLYVDLDRMEKEASKAGWNLQVIYEDNTGHYLGRLTMK
jgi:SAM-dependent methyltransferase